MAARRRRIRLREMTNTVDLRTEPAEAIHPSASFSTTVRVRLENHPGAFAGLARAIADAGGLLGAIDLVRVEGETKVRDVTILAGDARMQNTSSMPSAAPKESTCSAFRTGRSCSTSAARSR